MAKRRLLLWLYILLACTVLRGLFFYLHLQAPLDVPENYTFEVASGTTFNRLITRFAAEGIVSHPFDLRLYGRLSGRADAIKAGEYRLEPGMTGRDLLAELARGDVVVHQLVIVEGWTLAQAMAAIRGNAMVTATPELQDGDAVRRLLGVDVYPEGRIFPDTYNFSRGTTDREIVQRAGRLMAEILSAEWAGRDVGLPYANPDEALVMASIIEKETALASEREQIAGVFVRRLQRGMRLQTDPTVIYGLGEDFSGNLTRADLQRPSAYNTYLNGGLPPTPIALPGRDAIHASLHPDDSDTLYFVARGDGSHVFSSTLAEHEAAVQRYQMGNLQDQ